MYFSRLFKQETGENYSDFVIGIRIQKAMDYLKDPCYKVYEIGHLVGYKNTKYFHKLFKRQTGLTPSEYRDQL
ncbi:HTH-type transcriptional regulator YesS [compost metagenome]